MAECAKEEGQNGGRGREKLRKPEWALRGNTWESWHEALSPGVSDGKSQEEKPKVRPFLNW